MLYSNPFIIDFDEHLCPAGTVDDDPFLDPWNDTLRAFDARSIVSLLPGIFKEFRVSSIFQCIADGIVCRGSVFPQIIVWAQWWVRPRQLASSLTPDTPSSDQTLGLETLGQETLGQEWELHEDLIIESNSLLMPFVLSTTIIAHREINSGFLQEAIKSYITQRE